MINHAGVSYGHQMPWYGGPPRAYPIPPGHMYNMYHFNRYDYEDSKAACKILNGREARNRAEKNRRDKLNGSIQELSGMVPHVAESPRRMDKTAVLRLSAHALRVDYVFGKTTPKPETKPPPVVVQQPEVQDTLFRMLNGFLLTVTCRGQIVLVSASVEQFLGHCQTDLYGQSLYGMVHPDDLALLKQQLVPTNLANLFESSAPASSSSSGSRSAESNEDLQKRSRDEEAEIDEKLRQDRRRFNLRIARAGPRSEPTAYEMVTVDGCFRRADAAPRGLKSSGPLGLQLLRRGRGGREDGISLHSINGNDIVLVAMVRVMKVPTICDRLIEACKYEYKTRHLIDGRIVQCDHRISVVAGYMTNEVSGLSPFTFMHKDDVRWVIVALRQMYDYNQPNGESCYRLMTRTGDFIYLKTRGYLEVDDSTKVVKSFVCINTLVSDDEGRRLVQEMKRKFSVIVDQKDLPDESDEPAVENQQQIEQAVMNLITNFHPSNEEDVLRALPPAASPGRSSGPTGDGLAIIAPRPNAVKLSILKSMRVITIASKRVSTTSFSETDGEPNNTSAITQRPSVLQKTESRVPPLPSSDHYFTQPYSPAGSTSSSSSNSNSSILSPASAAATQQNLFQRNSRSPFGGSIPPPLSPPGGSGGPMASSASYVRGDNTASGHTRTTSVLKRTYSNSSISSSEGSELKRPKASPSDLSACLSELVDPGADLTTLLPDAFDAVDQTLLTMESTTAIMRGQVGEYEELHGAQVQQHRLDKIAEEQQEHREMLQSIQQEYTLQIQSNGGGAGGAVALAIGGNVGPIRRIDPVIMRPEGPSVDVPAAVAVTTSVITPNNNSTSSSHFYHRGADLSPS
nr:putative juvenile hormone resistant protein [Culex pipiens]